MAASRIEVFRQMLATDPGNTSVLFGLAKEYEKAGDDAEMITVLKSYLEQSDDEGNAYGMLARAYQRLGLNEEAREAYQRGIAAAESHQHPGMVEEYRATLREDYEATQT